MTARCPECGEPAAYYEYRARRYRCDECGEVTSAEEMPAVEGLAGWLEGMADSGQLPSQLLAHAQELNPGLEISIDYRPSAVIVVNTARGEVQTNRGPSEDWVRTFRRAGLL